MNNQVLSVEKWIEYYQKTLESGIETADTLRQNTKIISLEKSNGKRVGITYPILMRRGLWKMFLVLESIR